MNNQQPNRGNQRVNQNVVQNPSRKTNEKFEKPVPSWRQDKLTPTPFQSRRVQTNQSLPPPPPSTPFAYDPNVETYDEFQDDPSIDIDAQQQESVEHLAYSLSDNSCILLVRGIVAYHGPLEYVEKQARDMVFNKHELYKDVELNDIVVLKKASMKVGLFIE